MLNFTKGLYASGLTYVHHDYRKKNLALEMVRKAMERHKRNSRLLSTYSFKKWAEKSEEVLGFRAEIGFIAKRFISKQNVDIHLPSEDLPEDLVIHPFQKGHLDLICDYDIKVVNYQRQRYLELSCNEANSETLVALRNGRCVGFGSVKLSIPGAKRIGPLYADDPKIAAALLKSLLEIFQEGKGVAMVVPSSNMEAYKLVHMLDIPLNDELYQCYQKGFPSADVSKVYALSDVNGTSI